MTLGKSKWISTGDRSDGATSLTVIPIVVLTLPPVLVAVIVKVDGDPPVKEVGVPEITPVDESIDSPEISDDGETVQETTSPPE